MTAECEERGCRGARGPLGSQPFSSGRAAGVYRRRACAAGLPGPSVVLCRDRERRRVLLNKFSVKCRVPLTVQTYLSPNGRGASICGICLFLTL